MELGIKGRKAIVCASSRGLGRGCAQALAEAGCEVVINGRDVQGTGGRRRGTPGGDRRKVIPVAADVATAEGQAALLAACPEPDILVNNNAGPPFRDFRQLTRQMMIDGVIANMVVAVELTQKVIDPMVRRKFGRIVNITSGSVKMPLAGPRPVLGRAGRPDGLLRRRRPLGRGLQRHDQLPVARHLRHRTARHQHRGQRQEQGHSVRAGQGRPHGNGTGEALRHGRTNSARPARSCVRLRPATSPARTC